MPSPDAYARLRRVARRRGQRGHFTSAQAQAAGISRRELNRLVAHGLVGRVAPRVYRFSVAAAPTWKDQLAAELLSTGGRACGLSSAALCGLADPPAHPSVMVVRGGHGSRRHSTRELAASDCTTIDGLATLAPVRAILDAIHLVPPSQRANMIERAIVRGLVKPEILRRRAIELLHGKRPGCAAALRALDALHPELERSRNEWEALVVRRAKEVGLEPPRLEFVLFIDGRRYIADAAWPRVRVALEFDGRDPHMRRTVHDYDNERRNDFTSAGWRRFGITAAALKRGDQRVFRQVARAISTPNRRPGI